MPTTPYPPYPILLSLLAGSVLAQDASDPTPDQPKPTEQHQRVEIIDPNNTINLPRMGTDETPIEPTEPGVSKPHQTGLTEGQDWMKVVNNTIGTVSKPSALAEGSFILSRIGRLVPAPNDRLIFVPAIDQRLPGEGPVLLLPNATLQRLERIWANRLVTVSGEILTYHGRSHLLISDFALGFAVSENISQIQLNDTPGEPEQPEQTDDPVEDTPPGLDEDPDVLDLLRELDAESSAPSGADLQAPIDSRFSQMPQSSNQLQTAPPSLAPGLKEGTLLVRRPARLDRATDGSWMAVFDNDDPSTPEGIELTMLPCSLLMTMEHQAIAFGDSARFVVSGRVYIHNDRGYLLPTFFQRLRTSDIKPWQ